VHFSRMLHQFFRYGEPEPEVRPRDRRPASAWPPATARATFLLYGISAGVLVALVLIARIA
jgi:hypothetical protein